MATLTKRNVGPATILELGPRLTLVEGSELREAVDELLAEGRSSILLDCAQVRFIDSQGIGLLVRTWMSAGRGGKLKLFSLTPRVKEILQITGLLKVMAASTTSVRHFRVSAATVRRKGGARVVHSSNSRAFFWKTVGLGHFEIAMRTGVDMAHVVAPNHKQLRS